MSRNDLEYYCERALAVRVAAKTGKEPRVAAILFQWAEHYEAIVRLNGERERRYG
jgi:hypothetical protein